MWERTFEFIPNINVVNIFFHGGNSRWIFDQHYLIGRYPWWSTVASFRGSLLIEILSTIGRRKGACTGYIRFSPLRISVGAEISYPTHQLNLTPYKSSKQLLSVQSNCPANHLTLLGDWISVLGGYISIFCGGRIPINLVVSAHVKSPFFSDIYIYIYAYNCIYAYIYIICYNYIYSDVFPDPERLNHSLGMAPSLVVSCGKHQNRWPKWYLLPLMHSLAWAFGDGSTSQHPHFQLGRSKPVG